jgi:hypothetical protein
MARAKSNGNGRFEEALANVDRRLASLVQAQESLVHAQASLVQAQTLLTQQQTAFLARCAETDARLAKLQAEKAETDRINAERFARIEAILIDHSRILRALPDAIREKIGFKAPEPKPAEGGRTDS